MSKKFIASATAVLFVAASLVTGLSSAQAANKANGACAKANVSAKIGKNTYKCTYNPTATVKKLTWTSTICIQANTDLKSALPLSNSLLTSYNGRVSSATRQKNTNTKLITASQANVDKWSKDLAAYLAAHPTAETTGSEAEKKNIAAVKDGIARNKQRVIDLTATLTDLDKQIKEAQDGATATQADIDTAKATLAAACKL